MVNAQYSATIELVEKKSVSSRDEKYHRTTEKDYVTKATTTPEQNERRNTETELTRLKNENYQAYRCGESEAQTWKGNDKEVRNTKQTTEVANELESIVYVEDEELYCTISEDMVVETIGKTAVANNLVNDRSTGICKDVDPSKIYKLNQLMKIRSVVQFEVLQ